MLFVLYFLADLGRCYLTYRQSKTQPGAGNCSGRFTALLSSGLCRRLGQGAASIFGGAGNSAAQKIAKDLNDDDDNDNGNGGGGGGGIELVDFQS